ncbi:MAG: YCF48-related protein [Pseudomonadota bacterium]|nr:YCF48-related protein [Pseudomonadota bacterium]
MRKAIGAAALCCGVITAAWAAPDPANLPESGPLGATTLQRLLLVDAERFGSRIVAVGDRGYIVYSDDQGKGWKRAKAPPAPLLTALDFLDDNAGLAVGHDSVILATQDRGETWTQVFAAPAEQRPLLDVIFLTRETAIAVGAYGAYYESADGGKTWNPKKIVADDKHLNAILDLGASELVILGEGGTILASPDAGKTWTTVTSPYKGSFFGGLVANDGAVVAFGMRGRIYRSADKAKTWQLVENPSVATLMGGDKLPDGALVVAGSAGTALVSRDNGLTFVPLATGSTRAFSKAILGGPNMVLLLGESGAREVALPSAPKK